MGRFSQPRDVRSLSGKGFFGPGRQVTTCPFQILAGAGGMPGFSYNMQGWAGSNGAVGPGTVGAIVFGEAAVWGPGTSFAVGDVVSGTGPLVLAPPFFSVSTSGLVNQTFFDSVSINGILYRSIDAEFSNNGGDGPSIWGWAAPAGVVVGQDYCVIFVGST